MSDKEEAAGALPAYVHKRAVRIVREQPSQWKAIESISKKLAINDETLRIWVRRRRDRCWLNSPGLTTDERAKMKQLKKETRVGMSTNFGPTVTARVLVVVAIPEE